MPSPGCAASDERRASAPGDAGAAGPGRGLQRLPVGGCRHRYELDLFGRVRALSEAALTSTVARRDAQAVQISLVGAVATPTSPFSRLRLLTSHGRHWHTRGRLRLIKLRFDAGVSSELDYRHARSLLEAARVALAQSLRQRALDENALLLVRQHCPRPAGAAAALTRSRSRPTCRPALPWTCSRAARLRAAEQQLLAAQANIGAARAAFFPRISLTANLGTASSELDGLFKSGSFAFTGTAQLLQPIFDHGRNRANLEVAQVNRDIAIAQYERSIQTAFREVSDALAGRATLGEQLRAQAAQVQALAITSGCRPRYRVRRGELSRHARCAAVPLRRAAGAGADADAAAAEPGGALPACSAVVEESAAAADDGPRNSRQSLGTAQAAGRAGYGPPAFDVRPWRRWAEAADRPGGPRLSPITGLRALLLVHQRSAS